MYHINDCKHIRFDKQHTLNTKCQIAWLDYILACAPVQLAIVCPIRSPMCTKVFHSSLDRQTYEPLFTFCNQTVVFKLFWQHFGGQKRLKGIPKHFSLNKSSCFQNSYLLGHFLACEIALQGDYYYLYSYLLQSLVGETN